MGDAAEQLHLDFLLATSEDAVDGPRPKPWTYHRGLPDRSGAAKYLHLVMWAHDPTETRARGEEARKTNARGPDWQTKVAIEEQARAAILDLLASDHEPRTFNCLTMQLFGSGASGFIDTPTEAALWGLVEEGRLWWACEEDCVFFALAEDIDPDRSGSRQSLTRANVSGS